LYSFLNKKFGALAAPFAALGSEQIERLIASYAGKLIMGNIYGFSAGQALGQLGGVLSGDPTAMVTGAAGLANQLTPSKSLKNTSGRAGLNEPYFDRITPNESIESSSLGNNFDSSNRTGSNDVDSLGNVFGDPKNQTNDVDSLGNTFSSPSKSLSNETNDVDSLGNTSSSPSKSLSNETNDVDSLGNIFE
jgi:hypothetical protein